MDKIKPGDKFRLKKDFISYHIPDGKWSAGDIVEVASVSLSGWVVLKGEARHFGWNLCQEIFERVEEQKTMTPCEKLGYKVGDAFIAPYNSPPVKEGDIVYLKKDDASEMPFFSKTKDNTSPDVCFLIEHEEESIVAKPYKPQTEAEKRGAKFGVGGVIKDTGEKVIFTSERNGQWFVFSENSAIYQVYKASEIRLDHEPEYKEISFTEATHEQRMNVDNLVHNSGHKVTEIFQFKNGSCAFTIEGEKFNRTEKLYLTVRVPA